MNSLYSYIRRALNKLGGKVGSCYGNLNLTALLSVDALV